MPSTQLVIPFIEWKEIRSLDVAMPDERVTHGRLRPNERIRYRYAVCLVLEYSTLVLGFGCIPWSFAYHVFHFYSLECQCLPRKLPWPCHRARRRTSNVIGKEKSVVTPSVAAVTRVLGAIWGVGVEG